ncbi:dienelactone hydrolase family protein [Hypoxylon sp. NC0597]|nr:dienelactone hydrolase family protein [Hypoxylon sp. NC0597]
MAEADVATKAPESDAQENVIPGDTPAQTGPTLGEHCTSDRPTPIGLAPKGELRKLGGVDTYLTKPESYPTNPSKLLLLLSSGTGIKSTNNQIQADKFADEGFVVVMPDLFEGNPAPSSNSPVPEAEIQGTSFLDKIKLKAAEIAKSFVIDEWLARHTEEKVMPILEKVIDACKGEFADAVGNGGGIYAVGYCFGGRYVLLLAGQRGRVQTGWSGSQKPADEEAGEETNTTMGPYIKAGALAHATLVSPDDFRGLKVPVSLVCVESDPMFPDEVREAGENIMSTENVEHEVSVYPGVPHGFAVIGDYDDANIKDAQITAFEQMLRWIKEH